MIKQNKYGGYVEVGGTAYWIVFILVYIIIIGFDIFIITDTFKNKNKIKLLSSYIKDKESELEKLQEKFDAFEMNISSVNTYNYKQKFREKHDMLIYKNNPPLNVNWNELLSNPGKYRKKRIIPSDQIFIWSTTSDGFSGSAWWDKKGDIDMEYNININLIVDYDGPNKKDLERINVSTGYTHPLVRITGVIEDIKVTGPKECDMQINVEKLRKTRQLFNSPD